MYARSVRDGSDPMPLYGRVAAVLRSQIVEGLVKPGEALPPIDSLARTYGVARVTVRQAIQRLAHEGLVISRRGSRVMVTDGRRVRARETLYETVDVMSVLTPSSTMRRAAALSPRCSRAGRSGRCWSG